MKYYLGIDVGTGSARAGIFDENGRMVASASQSIKMWKPIPDHVEQSGDDIWRACCIATRAALKKAKLPPEAICGVGFDATCSLVAVDAEGKPVSLSTTDRDEQNVIVWMDHRAIGQAARINATKHPVLRYVGGVISPEMQTPKLLWLKENLPAAWKRAARFFDLPDFLTWRATGDDTRSLCSVVCKWTYLGHKGLDGAGWDRSYFQKIGIGDLAENNFERIGRRVRPMGEAIGAGLSTTGARDLGLRPGTPVGVSIIDAHAGGIGMLGAKIGTEKLTPASLNRRLALIGGTSTCHMAVSREPRFIHGIWGPYYSAMIPGLWLTEGGQSAVGALIDHVVFTHAAFPALKKEAKKSGRSIYDLLNERLDVLAESEGAQHPGALTQGLHVQPDFHGNRSPRANPALRGAISGLTLSATLDDLARLYLATIQALAYGTRHIIEEMNRKGYRINSLFVCGGGAKNRVFLREHANITSCNLVLPQEPEAVLLGAAVLGATAARGDGDVSAAMNRMNAASSIIKPAGGAVARYHNAKYKVFLRMHDDFIAYGALMKASSMRSPKGRNK